MGTTNLRVATGLAVGEFEDLSLAVDLHWPEEGEPQPLIFFCLPGDGLRRGYFDLGADPRYSLARQMAARGHISILMDHPGVGDSDRPEDGYLLEPELITRLHARALEQILDRLAAGRIDPACPVIEYPRAVAVGHSMGAMLAVLQQARWRQFHGLVLLGFGTDGLPALLPEQARDLAGQPDQLRARLPELAGELFGEPYPEPGGRDDEAEEFAARHADPEAVQALAAVREHLLALPALLSMVPGHVAGQARDIDVPVLLIRGERDPVAAPVEPELVYPAASAVTQITLPDSGHHPLLFPAREQLFRELADWTQALSDDLNGAG